MKDNLRKSHVLVIMKNNPKILLSLSSYKLHTIQMKIVHLLQAKINLYLFEMIVKNFQKQNMYDIHVVKTNFFLIDIQMIVVNNLNKLIYNFKAVKKLKLIIINTHIKDKYVKKKRINKQVKST